MGSRKMGKLNCEKSDVNTETDVYIIINIYILSCIYSKEVTELQRN